MRVLGILTPPRAANGPTNTPRLRGAPSEEVEIMHWETPRATEFRFGMEITLYIATR